MTLATSLNRDWEGYQRETASLDTSKDTAYTQVRVGGTLDNPAAVAAKGFGLAKTLVNEARQWIVNIYFADIVQCNSTNSRSEFVCLVLSFVSADFTWLD